MSNSFKNTWWIFLLIAAGGVLFFLSLRSDKPQNDQGMTLNDIFSKKADSLPPMKIVASPVNAHEAGLIIQVYSFQDKNRAEASLQVLENNGYRSSLAVSDLGKKGVWYRVRVGGIADKAAARKMLNEIRKNYNSGFILNPQN